MPFFSSRERERFKRFEASQEDLVDLLEDQEINAALGSQAKGIAESAKTAEPLEIKNDKIRILRRYRDKFGPFVLMLTGSDPQSIDISPIVNITAEQQDQQPFALPPLALGSYNVNRPRHSAGSLHTAATYAPSRTIIGDAVRTSPLCAGPIVMSKYVGLESAVTFGHEIDHFRYARLDQLVNLPVSRAVEAATMEFRGHNFNYQVYDKLGMIREVPIEDISEAYQDREDPQSIGNTLFYRIQGSYGKNSPQFAGHYVKAIKEISGNTSSTPTLFEIQLMAIGGMIPAADTTA